MCVTWLILVLICEMPSRNKFTYFPCEFRMRGHYHCLRPGCFFVTNITTKLPWHVKKHEKAERRAANGFKYFTKREECGRLGKRKYFRSCTSFGLLSLFLPFCLRHLVPYITPQALHVSLNTPGFDNILPGDVCGLKVLKWDRYRLIVSGCCKRIFSVFTKGESPVLANKVSCYVSGLRGMKQVWLISFVAVFCIFTMAPQVPKVALPVLYEQ